MYIRHLIGPRKGEVEDVIFDRARAKVLSGEAEDVYEQLGRQPKRVSIAAEPEVNAHAETATPSATTKKKARR